MNPPDHSLVQTRIGRVTFLIRYVLLIVAAAVGGLMLTFSEDVSSSGAKIALCIGAIIIYIGVLVALFRSVLVPRVRDTGLHPAWTLMIFFPLLNFLFLLALFFIPGDAFTKRPSVA